VEPLKRSRRKKKSNCRDRLLPSNRREKLRSINAVWHKINDTVMILGQHDILEPLRHDDLVKRQSVGSFASLDWQIRKNFMVLNEVYLRTLLWRQLGNPFGRFPPGRDNHVGIGNVLVSHRARAIQDRMVKTRTVQLRRVAFHIDGPTISG
jgi:hypothetical protein